MYGGCSYQGVTTIPLFPKFLHLIVTLLNICSGALIAFLQAEEANLEQK